MILFEPVPFAFVAEGAEAARIPLAMLIVFASAKIFGELCERLGQPGIVGEILAGFRRPGGPELDTAQ